jgi:hypothetical protein
MLGNLNITAGESTYSQEYKMRSQSLGGSVGNNGWSANLGFSEAQSSLDQTTFTNSQITAQNGSLNITTSNKDSSGNIIDDKGNATIFGANLLAQNINMNIANNLTVKSKQNLMESDSYNFGMNIGVSGGMGESSGGASGANGGSLGFNLGDGYSNRAWVDQMTTIVGTNSVNINTTNNTNEPHPFFKHPFPSKKLILVVVNEAVNLLETFVNKLACEHKFSTNYGLLV